MEIKKKKGNLLLSNIWEKGKDDLCIQACAASFKFPKSVLTHHFKDVFIYFTKFYQLYQSIDYKMLHYELKKYVSL